eukprot:m.88349 g.88349  ORF g.88349 m.88349 type:complete len:1295 (-) comp8366_c0_seq2:2436-6320(-)
MAFLHRAPLLVLVLAALARAQPSASAPQGGVNAWTLESPKQPASGPAVAFHAATRLQIGEAGSLESLFQDVAENSVELFMILFGGISAYMSNSNDLWTLGASTTYSADMWLFCINTWSWKFLPQAPGSAWPAPRAGHVLHTFRVFGTSIAVLFGGRDSDTIFSDTWVWAYDPTMLYSNFSTSWQPLACTGPSARWGAGSATSNNTLYIFGGATLTSVVSNELWKFVLLSPVEGQWTRLWEAAPSGAGPAGRLLFSMGLSTWNSSLAIVLSGGWRNAFLNDTSLPLSDCWVAVLPSGPSAPAWISVGSGPQVAAGLTVSIETAGPPGALILLRGLVYSAANTFTESLYPIVFDDVYGYDPDTTTWVSIPLGGSEAFNDYPGSTIGQSAIAYGREVFLYGGYNTFLSLLGTRISRVLITDLVNGSVVWMSGDLEAAPAPRECSQAVAFEGVYYVMGGWMSYLSRDNYVWAYTISTGVWNLLPILNVPARVSGSTILIGSLIVMYGGIFRHENGTMFLRGDLITVDTTTMTATVEVSLNGIEPPPRQLHSAVEYDGSMFVFGGVVCAPGSFCSGTYSMFLNQSTAELWAFLPNYGWENLTETGVLWPAARNKHAAAVLSLSSGMAAMFVHGGCDATTVFGDLWMFLFANVSWSEVLPTPNNPFPFPRCWHYAAPIALPGQWLVSSRMHMFNGVFDSPETGLVYYSDSWVFDAHALAWFQISADAGYQDNVTCSAYAYDYSSNTVLSFGGIRNALQADLTGSLLDDLSLIRPGCNVGLYSADFRTQSCKACPVGSYSSQPGATACTSCAAGITTPGVGATAKANCSICGSSSCNNRGTCHVDSRGSIYCTDCHLGYSGAQCEQQGTLVAIILVCILVPLIIVLWRVWKVLRRRARLASQYQAKLEQTSAAARAASEVFSIDASNIQLDNDVLGQGAAGAIHLGRYFGVRVALKVIANQEMLRELGDDDAFMRAIKQFSAEGRTLSSLHHVNIVRFYGTSIDDGCPLLVMEYCERGSLFNVIRDTDLYLDWPEIHQLGSQCAMGMAYLHSRKLVHRDLKSLNVFVSADWTVKVGDFGNSHNFRVGTSRGTRPRPSGYESESFGTTHWCAPELLQPIEQEPHRLGASDVYSYAIVMWEIASGRTPYYDIPLETAIDFDDLRKRIVMGLRPRLEDLKAVVPPGYARLMVQCWSAGAHLRPPFTEIVSVLDELRPPTPAFGPSFLLAEAEAHVRAAAVPAMRRASSMTTRRTPSPRAAVRLDRIPGRRSPTKSAASPLSSGPSPFASLGRGTPSAHSEVYEI